MLGGLGCYRYVGNSPLNYVDPTGTTQAGNPLGNLNLFAGGYSGGTVSANKLVNPYIGSTSIFAQPTFNPYASSLANSSSPIITQAAKPFSNGSLSAGTLGTVLANSVISAAPSLVSPTALSTAKGLGTVALVGGYFGDVLEAGTGFARGLKDSVDRTARGVYEGVSYAIQDPVGAVGSVAGGAQSVLFTGLDYTIGWTAEFKREQNIANITNTYHAITSEFDRLKNASLYEQARAIGDGTGTVGQFLAPGTNLARGTRATSTFRPLAVVDDATQDLFTETLTHRNGIYEVLSQQPISGASRNTHRAAANRTLLQQLESDSAMARQLGQFLRSDDLIGHMRSGSSGLRNPPGTVWHHPIDSPDIMQLLRRETHRAPELQPTLHPGPQNRGGYGTFYGN